jgi:hypothetical protein
MNYGASAQRMVSGPNKTYEISTTSPLKENTERWNENSNEDLRIAKVIRK